jgi:hypothetical protein
MMKRLQALPFFICLFLVAGCVTAPAPQEEYVLARAAIESARTVESARHSPGNYHQAEEAFRKAKTLFEEREYDEAKDYFIKARVAAEKAENSARLIRFKNGEVL